MWLVDFLRRARTKSAADVRRWLRGDDLVEGASERLSEPYRHSTWVRAAVEKVSGPISAVAVEFYPAQSSYVGISKSKSPPARRKVFRTSRGLVRVEEGEELELPQMQQFLRHPMTAMGWNSFCEATVGWSKLAGEVFWLLPDDALVPFRQEGAPFQVILARPDRMRHVVQDGVLQGWVFTDGAGRQYNLLPEQVIHSRRWNPYDEFRGLSQYEAARIAAEADWMAGRFARNLASNNGDTGPYIVAKGGIPGDDQREQILADLKAKRRAQQAGQFRPVFLTGDITVEDPQIRTVDASYIAARIENRHEIAVAFGVPPSMFDVKASYSIGSASDFYQLILNTCIPEGDRLCDMLNRVASAMTGQAVEALLDWDEHPVLQEVRKERLASVDTLWNKGVPMAVIDDYLGLGLPDYPGKEFGYLPFGVMPTTEGQGDSGPAAAEPAAQDPTQDPSLGETEEDPVLAAVRALKAGPRAEPDCECCGWSVEHRDGDPERDPREVSQWRTLIAKRQSTVRAFRSKVDRALMEARVEVLQKLEAKYKAAGGGGATRSAGAEFIFDLSKFQSGLVRMLRGVSADALQLAGEQLLAEVGKDLPWQMPAPKATEFLRERENRIKDASEAIHGQIMRELEMGLQEGDTLAQMASRVKGSFNQLSNGRALVIARTETSAAYGVARKEAMRSAGIEYKRWLVSGNSNVRAAHRAMNGVTVPLNEPFVVIDPKTGDMDEVQHPGDPQGQPWNIINCACIEVPETEPPEQ